MASSAEGGAEDALRGRTALVTGASRGIGRAVARGLRRSGARVALVARGAEALVEAAEELGAHALSADVSDAESVERLPEALLDALGTSTPDIVVQAAGAFELAPVAELELESFDRQIAVNLRGAFLVIRTFLSGMLERGSGHLVTIGSVAGRQAFPHNGAYAASKFGVRGLHEVLATELGGTGVRSTLVEPAATATPLWDEVDYDRHPALPPPEAMMEPRAVADAVLYAVRQPSDVAVRTISVERA